MDAFACFVEESEWPAIGAAEGGIVSIDGLLDVY